MQDIRYEHHSKNHENRDESFKIFRDFPYAVRIIIRMLFHELFVS